MKIETYKNLSGNAGVKEYLFGDSSIKIKFVYSDKVYKYSSDVIGSSKLEEMKSLAEAGLGLSGFISQNFKNKSTFTILQSWEG